MNNEARLERNETRKKYRATLMREMPSGVAYDMERILDVIEKDSSLVRTSRGRAVAADLMFELIDDDSVTMMHNGDFAEFRLDRRDTDETDEPKRATVCKVGDVFTVPNPDDPLAPAIRCHGKSGSQIGLISISDANVENTEWIEADEFADMLQDGRFARFERPTPATFDDLTDAAREVCKNLEWLAPTHRGKSDVDFLSSVLMSRDRAREEGRLND